MPRTGKRSSTSRRALQGARPAPATAILLDQGCLLLLLAPGDAAPPASAALEGGAESWRCLAWNGRDGPAAIGLLRAGDRPLTSLESLFVYPPEADAPWRLPAIGRLELDPEILADFVRATAGKAAAVFDFLHRELLDPEREAVTPRMQEFLQRFLFAISHRDGFVEILGVPECGGLFFQGWSQRLTPGERDLGLVASGFAVSGCILAAFERSDLLPPARGLVGFAKDARGVEPDRCRALFFEGDAELLRLDVVRPERILLNPPDVVAHLGDMLGRLQAEDASLRGFKRVCRPRFPGHETLSGVTAPVRLVIDLAIAAPGAGILVMGWLLDPERRTRMVLLKSTGNHYARLSDRWARLARPDVSEAFAADPLFGGLLLAEDRYHGFIAFAPRPAAPEPGERFYLELVLEDESCAFLPVEIEQGTGLRQLPRILGSINTDDPEIERIVAWHLAPFTAAVRTGRPRPAAPAAPLPLGAAGGRREVSVPEVSVLVALAGDVTRAEVIMACLADDPDFAAAELLFVTARDHAAAIAGRLARWAEFYRLRGRLLVAQGPLDVTDALALGAEAASGELLLILAPSVLPPCRGWLARLVRELACDPSRGLVCPTLLYEDESIRYAGRPRPPGGTAPAPERLAGYPSVWLREAAAGGVAHGPLECFLIRRSLFLEVGSRAGPFVGFELYHLDLARRLAARGLQCVWVPDVQLYAVDDEAPQPDEHWRRVGQLVDRQVLEQLSADPVSLVPHLPGVRS